MALKDLLAFYRAVRKGARENGEVLWIYHNGTHRSVLYPQHPMGYGHNAVKAYARWRKLGALAPYARYFEYWHKTTKMDVKVPVAPITTPVVQPAPINIPEMLADLKARIK